MATDLPAVDWTAVRHSEPFQQLVSRRGRYVRVAAVVLLGWFAVFLAVVGTAPALAGTVVFAGMVFAGMVVAGMTVGFLLGLSQFVLAWFLTWQYLRLSTRRFSDLEDEVRVLAGVQTAGSVEVTR